MSKAETHKFQAGGEIVLLRTDRNHVFQSFPYFLAMKDINRDKCVSDQTWTARGPRNARTCKEEKSKNGAFLVSSFCLYGTQLTLPTAQGTFLKMWIFNGMELLMIEMHFFLK